MEPNVTTKELQNVFGLSRRQAAMYHTKYPTLPAQPLRKQMDTIRKRCKEIVDAEAKPNPTRRRAVR